MEVEEGAPDITAKIDYTWAIPRARSGDRVI